MNICQKIKNIQGWELRKGKNELLRHIEGGNKPLTLKEAITAKCYDCCCGYPEGAQDCGVPDCPLHDFMPYRDGGVRKLRTVSDEQREQARARLAKKTPTTGTGTRQEKEKPTA